MDPNTLRSAILEHTARHEVVNDGVYLEDVALAAIGVSLADVQKQIRILGAEGLSGCR